MNLWDQLMATDIVVLLLLLTLACHHRCPAWVLRACFGCLLVAAALVLWRIWT